MKAPLTLTIARRVVYALATKHFARLVHKQDAAEMKAVSVVFDALRIAGVQVPSGADFLDRYATTLAFMVYLPDEVWTDPLALLEVGVHEIQHVHQFWTGGEQVGLGGNLQMAWLYLAHPEARVRYEAEAYRSGIELRHALGLPQDDVAQLAVILETGYAVPVPQAKLFERLLEGAQTEARFGRVVTKVAQDAIALLRAEGVV